MRGFEDRLKISNEQRKEVMRYLNSMTVLSEESILKIIRKIKEVERKIDEKRYT